MSRGGEPHLLGRAAVAKKKGKASGLDTAKQRPPIGDERFPDASLSPKPDFR